MMYNGFIMKEALIEHKGELYPIYQLLLAYEKGNWLEVNGITSNGNIDENSLVKGYLESIE